MSFLTPILLAGTAAFLVPLLLHLLNRRRVVPVPWGAMHLLHEALHQRKRRVQIEQWLLLLTRILIPIVLALSLARPVLNALQQLPGFGKTSMVLVIDDSFSMQAESAEGDSLQDLARTEAARLLEQLPPGSDVQVLRIGDLTRPLTDGPRSDLEALSQSLHDGDSLRGPLDLQEGFQSILSALQEMQNAGREVVLMSDFREGDWKGLAEGAPLAALDERPETDGPQPMWTLYQLPGLETENLSISDAELSAQIAAINQPVALTVTVRNHGDRPWQDVPVHLETDGQRLRTARLSLPPQGEGSLRFTHAFDQLGDHGLTVQLEGDGFTIDNRFHAVVQVRDQVPVVLIEGDPGRTPLTGSVDFLELALAPNLQSRAAQLRDLIVTRRVDSRRLKAGDLAGARVVILGAVERPNANLVQTLHQFATEGGGVWILPSEDADPLAWQKEMNRAKDLLPALVTGQGNVASIDRPARFQAERFTHPALVYFNDPIAGRLRDSEIQHWWELQPKDDARVLSALDQGLPLLVERPLGRGLVMMSALPMRPGWSNLPLQPWFVPLTQRLTAWLAIQDTESAWHLLGDSVRLPLDPNAPRSDFESIDPDGLVEPLQVKGSEQEPYLELVAPAVPGIFDLNPVQAGSNPASSRRVAVNLDPAESHLTALDADSMQRLGERLGAEVVTSFDGYQALDRSRRFGTEIWKTLLWALLGLLFLEVLLQQRITSTR